MLCRQVFLIVNDELTGLLLTFKELGEVVYNGEMDRIDNFVEEIQVLTEEIELLDYKLLHKKMSSVEVKGDSSEEVSEEEILDKEEVTLPEEEKE